MTSACITSLLRTDSTFNKSDSKNAADVSYGFSWETGGNSDGSTTSKERY